MKKVRTVGFLLPVAVFVLSACNTSTAPKFPDPTEPGAPRDSVPDTGAIDAPIGFYA